MHSLARRAGAMDGVVQLHRLDAAPQAVKPAWRRGSVQSRGQQVQRLPCQTTEFRCHQGRVKVWPGTVQGSGLRVLPGPPSRYALCQSVAQGASMHTQGQHLQLRCCTGPVQTAASRGRAAWDATAVGSPAESGLAAVTLLSCVRRGGPFVRVWIISMTRLTSSGQ